jgi:Rieske Fe-S protein
MTPPEPRPEPESIHQQTPPAPATDSTHPGPASAHSGGHSRRVFLFKLSLLLNGAVGVVLAIPIVGYLLGPAARKAGAGTTWVPLGPLTDFPEGETRLVDFRNPVTTKWDGTTGNVPCWVRRISGNSFQVFAINCAHLGCPVRWFAQSKLFLCPCHGGAYYADGSRASGPPERGLFEYANKISGNTLLIKVGNLPTLANPGTARTTRPLVQIDGAAPATLASAGQSGCPGAASQFASDIASDITSGCGSCQG